MTMRPGIAQEYRAAIAEALAMVRMYANHGVELANVDDDHALRQSIGSMVCYVKRAVRGLEDLTSEQQRICDIVPARQLSGRSSPHDGAE